VQTEGADQPPVELALTLLCAELDAADVALALLAAELSLPALLLALLEPAPPSPRPQ
jgi:hypothetical protein